MLHSSRILAVAACAALPAASLAQTSARLVAEVGGTIAVPGGTAVVSSLNLPLDDGAGGVAFTSVASADVQ